MYLFLFVWLCARYLRGICMLYLVAVLIYHCHGPCICMVHSIVCELFKFLFRSLVRCPSFTAVHCSLSVRTVRIVGLSLGQLVNRHSDLRSERLEIETKLKTETHFTD